MNRSKDVSVVLPTYNEADSLPRIVPQIASTLAEAGLDYEIIVVDDDSPDGTAEVARTLGREHSVRTIQRRDERGLATAVLRGFAESDAQVCVVMDADGSHPVSALPGMIRPVLEDKADVVVGSRHIEGGGSRNWPLVSQLKSKLASLPTIGLSSMTDPTTGLMAVRRGLLEHLDLDPVGWKIVLEVVVKARPCRLLEVPIIFEDRMVGESKQSLTVAIEYALHLSKLYTYRFPTLSELARFCLVGLSGLFVDLATVFALKESLGLDTRLCAVLGFCAAVTTNYTFNRIWTFRHARKLPIAWSYLMYVAANLLGLAVRMTTVHLLIVLAQIDAGYGYLLSNAIGIALATLFNFVGAKFFAFDPARLSIEREAAASGSAERKSDPRTFEGTDATPAPSGKVRLLCGAVVAGALALAAGGALGEPQLHTADETVNVTMARNMVESFDHVVRPSVFPGGRDDWVRDDLPALGNLPFYPALLALLWPIGGVKAMALLSLLALAATVYFTYRLLAIGDRRAATYCALLLATSPAFVERSLHIEFEPLLTALCAAGLYCFVSGVRGRSRGRCICGGVLGGLAFLTKMWLIVPYLFAACAFILMQATVVRGRESHPLRLRYSVLYAGLGFAVTASAHIAFVLVTSPADLPLWLSEVYLGIFSGHGVTGEKLSALGRYAGTTRSPWYYPSLLYREHFVVIPLSLFGIAALLRRNRSHALGVLAMSFGAALSLVVLSVPAVKEPLYVLALVPLGYALAATCLSEVEGDSAMHGPSNRAMINSGRLFALLSVIVVAGAALEDSSYRYLAVHTAGMVACAIVGQALIRRVTVPLRVATLCAASLPIALVFQL